MIPAEINGLPTDFLFDPGAALTGINRKFADYFGISIDPTRTMRITTAHDREVDMPIITLKEIRVGGVIRKNLPALVITFPPNFEVHGLIGMNFLKGLRFTVEMDTGTLILREARKS
jgi:clan AA aspartic protease (TIGR02281 family)